MTKKGLFIVFEGIDGAGTTTQANLLQKWMTQEGHACFTTCEPSDGPIGSLARQIVKKRVVSRTQKGEEAQFDADTLAMLFAADRLDHTKSFINPLTAAGKHVICDRYVVSSLAYQGHRSGYDWVKRLNDRIARPDITFFLRVRPEVAVARMEASRPSRDMFEHLSSLRDVAAAYDWAVQADTYGLITINGEQSEENVHADIIAQIDGML